MSGLDASTGPEIGRRVLPPIVFAAVHRRHLGHRIGDDEPFDPVDFDHLSARGPVRRLAARHVIGVLDINYLVPRLEFFLDEFERARPNHLGYLLVGIGLGEPLRHDERRQARHFGDTVDQQRKRLLQTDREALVVPTLHLVDDSGERLTERIARHPPFERGDAIGAAHRLPIVEFEPVAQREAVEELVRRDAEIADHLRMRLELRVERKQRVEHHVAVVARDVRCRPDRIEHMQIRLGDEPQRLRVAALSARCEAVSGQCRRAGGYSEFSTCQPVSHCYLRRSELTLEMVAKTAPHRASN